MQAFGSRGRVMDSLAGLFSGLVNCTSIRYGDATRSLMLFANDAADRTSGRRRRHYTRSKIMAMPWPTPMHIVHKA